MGLFIKNFLFPNNPIIIEKIAFGHFCKLNPQSLNIKTLYIKTPMFNVCGLIKKYIDGRKWGAKGGAGERRQERDLQPPIFFVFPCCFAYGIVRVRPSVERRRSKRDLITIAN